MNKIKVGGKYYMSLILGILIPFIGTTLGASMVFFMKKEINNIYIIYIISTCL